ncbi:hypothetical protein F5D26_19965 [Burkholderia pseudomallei]|nr:hypothetical protein F5D26_19965 [Burkholderia pseudomallei]
MNTLAATSRPCSHCHGRRTACGDGRDKGDAAGDVRGGRPRGQAGGALGGVRMSRDARQRARRG